MLKDYLKQNNISLYSLSKQCDIPYSTLNNLSNGKVDIDNCSFGMLKKISRELSISLDELSAICSQDSDIKIDEYNIAGKIKIKNKKYYANFTYQDEDVELFVCNITEDSSLFVKDAAEWDIKKYISEKEFESAHEIYFDEKR